MSSIRPNQSSGDGDWDRMVAPPTSLWSPQVTEMLRVCGEKNMGLLAHHVAMFSYDYDVRYTFLDSQISEQQWENIFLLERPLERALKDILSLECSYSALRRLVMKNGVIAGSMAEGLHHNGGPPIYPTKSDADIMVEFGPVEWIFPADQTSPKPASDGGGAAEVQSDVAAPRLTITETGNPGFVLLLQEPSSDCQHQESLPFRSEDIKRFYSAFQRRFFDGTWKLDSEEGPACSYSQIPDVEQYCVTEMDHVPCLHVPVWWISDEFFTRRRRYSWPPKSARDAIRRYGLHLVAKGAPGSITQRFEWRISFSRAEFIVSLYLTLVQKSAVILFKTCKAALGEERKALKSYYVKTALLWLCEVTDPAEWTSVHHGVWSLVDYLDAAVHKKYLPCFFLSRINLLRFVSRNDLKAMTVTLGTIREHLMRLLAYNACTAVPDLAGTLIQHSRRLSETQVRVYLIRYVITFGLLGAAIHYLDVIVSDMSKLLPMLLRSYPSDGTINVLRSRLSRFSVQEMLYITLTMAPADVMAEVFQSLSGNRRDGFVWDAAPLLGLLTEEDLKYLLWDPDAVRVWLRRQRRLPTDKRLPGLPADLRSPRDLCDLLLNIPLLVQVLEECVPDRFIAAKATPLVRANMPSIDMHSMEKMREMSLHNASQWKELAAVLQSELGADRATAWRIACRCGVEMRQLCDSPETLEEHRRISRTLPDAWQMQHLAWDDAAVGGITAT